MIDFKAAALTHYSIHEYAFNHTQVTRLYSCIFYLENDLLYAWGGGEFGGQDPLQWTILPEEQRAHDTIILYINTS